MRPCHPAPRRQGVGDATPPSRKGQARSRPSRPPGPPAPNPLLLSSHLAWGKARGLPSSSPLKKRWSLGMRLNEASPSMLQAVLQVRFSSGQAPQVQTDNQTCETRHHIRLNTREHTHSYCGSKFRAAMQGLCVYSDGAAAIRCASYVYTIIETSPVSAGHSPSWPWWGTGAFMSSGAVVIKRHHNIMCSRVSAATPLPPQELVPGRRRAVANVRPI